MPPPSRCAMTNNLLEQQNWRYFLRRLQQLPGYAWTRQVTNEGLTVSLVTPVAIARWIDAWHPEYKDRAALHLVVAGAELGPDTFDDGRWYQIIPLLLNRPNLVLTVSLVGPDVRRTTRQMLDEQAAPLDTRRTLCLPAHWAAATLHECTLGAYLADAGGVVDLCVLPHPGFDLHLDDWFASNEVPRALRAHIPVGCMAYDYIEFEHERWMLSVIGYACKEGSLPNPLAVEMHDSPMPAALCAVIWEISDSLPPPGFIPNRELLVKDHRRHLDMTAFVLAGYGADVNMAGDVLDIDGEPAYYLPVGMAIKPNTGQLLRLVADEAHEVVMPVATGLLRAFPSSAADPYEVRAWAMDVALDLRNTFDAMQTAVQATGNLSLPAGWERVMIPAEVDAGRVDDQLCQLLDAGDVGALKAYLAAVPNGMTRCDPSGKTALFHALMAHQEDLATWLVDQGADPNEADSEGWHALDELARRGNKAALEFALGLGANPNLANRGGWTPLMHAARNGHSDIVLTLARHGANANAATLAGAHAADMAVSLSTEALAALAGAGN